MGETFIIKETFFVAIFYLIVCAIWWFYNRADRDPAFQPQAEPRESLWTILWTMLFDYGDEAEPVYMEFDVGLDML